MSASLHRDSRGAIMVLALVMAIIGIGALYYLFGLGEAILAQERMQDAADATAFSSAVVHARGMNLLALINIIMASVLAILVLLAMLASILEAGAKVLTFAAILLPFLAAGVAPMQGAARSLRTAEKAAKPQVQRVLAASHKLQGPLAKAIPVIANVNALKLSMLSYGPVVEGGTTFPIFERLPTVDGSFDDLCAKAGEYAGLMAVFPITGLMGVIDEATNSTKVSRFIGGRLRRHAKRLGKTYANFYCGDGKMPKPPKMTAKIAVPELNHPSRISCEKGHEGDSCERYAALRQKVRDAYDLDEARCISDDPQVRNYCEQIRNRARRECYGHGDQDLEKTSWVQRQVTRTYRIVGKGKNRRVVALEPVYGDGQLRSGEHFGSGSPVPCSRGPLRTSFTEWERDPSAPVCFESYQPPGLGDFRGGDELSLQTEEITDIMECIAVKEITSELSGERFGDRSKTPQEMCSCAAQGEEMFQVRSFVVGDASALTRISDKGILIATGGEEPEEGNLAALAKYAGRIAAAQAEYYFDGSSASSATWLWEMKWKARMRRLSFHREPYQCPAAKNTCSGATSPTSQLGNSALVHTLLEAADAVIVH